MTVEPGSQTNNEFLDRATIAGHALIPRMEKFDRKVFQREYEAEERPVILEGCIQSWRAYQLWTPDYMKDEFGDSVCHASINLPEGAAVGGYNREDFTKWMKLGEFVEFMRASDKPCYMQQVPQGLFGGRDEWSNHERITDLGTFNIYVNIFLGSGNTNSSLHYDMPNNFLAQIYGNKQVYLFPPEQRRHIATYADSLRMSPVDPYAPNLKRYPDYANARGLVGVINPGNILFIPRTWWHQLRSMNEAISINCWYGSEASATYLLKVAAANGVSHFARLLYDFVRLGVLRQSHRQRLFGDVPTGKWCYDVFTEAIKRRVGGRRAEHT